MQSRRVFPVQDQSHPQLGQKQVLHGESIAGPGGFLGCDMANANSVINTTHFFMSNVLSKGGQMSFILTERVNYCSSDRKIAVVETEVS